MKTLKKIELKDAAALSNYQLKQIRGGSGYAGSGGSGVGKGGACVMVCNADQPSNNFSLDCNQCPTASNPDNSWDFSSMCNMRGLSIYDPYCFYQS